MTAAQAKVIARLAHRGQLDKGGAPYIEHPQAVAQALWDAMCRTDLVQVVALLHDVVEDGHLSFAELAVLGCDAEQLAAIRAISRDKSRETYGDYIRRVSHDPTARLVKFYDLSHNLSPLRDIERFPGLKARYENAFKYLQDKQDNSGQEAMKR